MDLILLSPNGAIKAWIGPCPCGEHTAFALELETVIELIPGVRAVHTEIVEGRVWDGQVVILGYDEDTSFIFDEPTDVEIPDSDENCDDFEDDPEYPMAPESDEPGKLPVFTPTWRDYVVDDPDPIESPAEPDHGQEWDAWDTPYRPRLHLDRGARIPPRHTLPRRGYRNH